jgi:hypothetical protein
MHANVHDAAGQGLNDHDPLSIRQAQDRVKGYFMTCIAMHNRAVSMTNECGCRRALDKLTRAVTAAGRRSRDFLRGG